MKKPLKITLIVIASLAIIIGGGVLYILQTPEYAMLRIYGNIKEDGIDAVLCELTEDARESVEPILEMSGEEITNMLGRFFPAASDIIGKSTNNAGGAGEGVEEIIEDVSWSFGDIEKDGSEATVELGFDYNDKVVGTVDIEILRVDGEWKIDDLGSIMIEKLAW